MSENQGEDMPNVQTQDVEGSINLPRAGSQHESAEPTEPGFYKYSGGGQTMLFLLHNYFDGKKQELRWYVLSDSAEISECSWEYIEQALDVWDLVKI